MSTKGELYFALGTQIEDPMTKITYTLKKLIGRGAYAQCFLTVTERNEHFAMKIVKYEDLKTEKLKQKLQSEINIHKSLNHPNIVKMYSSFRNTDFVFMILELCERGALDDLLKRNTRIKEKYVSKFTFQIVKGLLYLHNEMSVVHRDLKLGNLFLDNHLNIKIGDFGLSAVIKDGERRKTVCGTPNYIAPEVLFGKVAGHSFEADIWSLGVIIYTLLIGVPPFQQKTVDEIYKLIELNQYIFPSDCSLSSEAIDLITRLLTTNPNDRPDLQQILEHKFLSQNVNLAYRFYKSLITNSYRNKYLQGDHVVYSIPISAVKGIGYVLKSGICGIYYQDLVNVYYKSNVFVYIKCTIQGDKKIFIRDEHSRHNVPESLKEYCKHINYFIKNYTHLNFEQENIKNTHQPNITENHNEFVAKVKTIKDGLLFVMTNNIFVFDFNDGRRVAVGEDGTAVYAFDDDGRIEFTPSFKERCTSALLIYCNNR